MSAQGTDTIRERAAAARQGLGGSEHPSSASVTVDGRCPADGCGARYVVEVRGGLDSITCPTCGSTFPI